MWLFIAMKNVVRHIQDGGLAHWARNDCGKCGNRKVPYDLSRDALNLTYFRQAFYSPAPRLKFCRYTSEST